MGEYFYSICACGIICGLVKRLTDEKYREIINFFTYVLVATVILQPIGRTKGIPFDVVNGIENKSEETLSMIYSEELKNKLNILLEGNAYNAKVENIYCECKDGEIEMTELIYSGDMSAGTYLSDISGISKDRVLYSG